MQRGKNKGEDTLAYVQRQNKEIRELQKKVDDIKEKHHLPLTENLEEMQRKLDVEYDQLLEQGREYKIPSQALHQEVRAKEKVVKQLREDVEDLKGQLKAANKSSHLVQAISLLQVMQATQDAIGLEKSALTSSAKFKALDGELAVLMKIQRDLIVALDNEKQSMFAIFSSEEEISTQLNEISQKIQDKTDEIVRATEANAERNAAIRELEAQFEQLKTEAKSNMSIQARIPVWEDLIDRKTQANMIVNLQEEIAEKDKANQVDKLKANLEAAQAKLETATKELHEARAKHSRSDEIRRQLPIVKKTWAVSDRLEAVESAIAEIAPIQQQITDKKSELDKYIKNHTATAQVQVEKAGFFAHLTTKIAEKRVGTEAQITPKSPTKKT